jgi:hypothetical protein
MKQTFSNKSFDGKLKLLLISMLLIVVFTLNTIPSEAKVDKYYDLESKTITIENKFLDLIPYGKVSEITLINNTYKCANHCSAEWKIDLVDDYYDPVGMINFYKQFNGNNYSTSISNKVLVKIGEHKEDKIKYVYTCEDLSNGSKHCYDKEDGTYKETVNDYKEYVPEMYNKGEYYFRIEGEKNLEDRIEWIPTITGFTIDEWALWDFVGITLTHSTSWSQENGLKIQMKQTLKLINVTLDPSQTCTYVNLEYENRTPIETHNCVEKNVSFGSTLNIGQYYWIVTNNSGGGGAYSVRYEPIGSIGAYPINSSYVSYIKELANGVEYTDEWNSWLGLTFDLATYVPYFINISTFPRNSTGYVVGFKLNATVTINNTNFTNYRTNVSFTWYNSSNGINWQMNISNATLSTISNPNATNVQATGKGLALIAPYNLTLQTGAINQYYMMSIYACNGLGCNQTNSSRIFIENATLPKIINITTYPNTSLYYYLGLRINGTVWVNNSNTGYRNNISYTWYQDGIVNISNNTGKHSMINATNIIASGNGNMTRVPYNLTSYKIGSNYTLGVYICDGISCNQMNSSPVFIYDIISSFSIVPSTNNATQDINGSVYYTGSGTGSVIFNWLVNGVSIIYKTFIVTPYNWVSDIFSEGNYTVGDNITLNINITDSKITNRSYTTYANITSNFTYDILTFYDTNNITEGSVQIIQVNVTHSSESNVTNVTLIFDNITHQALRNKYDGTVDLWNLSVNTPMGGGASYFQWNFSFEYDHDTSFLNNLSVMYRMNYSTISIGNTSGIAFLNFTFFREQLPIENISGKLDATFEIWFANNPNNNKTLNFSTNNISFGTGQLFLNIFPNETIFQANAIIDYINDNYDKRQYYYYHANFSNDTQIANLYLLEIAYGTGTQLTVTDENGNPLESSYIKIQRYYPGENSFKTIAMARTDKNGQDFVYLRHNDAHYRFIIERNGAVIYTSAMMKVTGALTFKVVGTGITNMLQTRDGLYYTATFNNVTNNFFLTYDDPTGEVLEGCLFVSRASGGNDTVICNNCTVSSSATLICNMGSASADYSWTFYIRENPIIYVAGGVIEVLLQLRTTIQQAVGLDGVVAAFILTGTLALAGWFNPTVGIVLGLIALVMSYTIGFMYISLGALTVVVIVGIILAVRLKS